MENGLSLLNCLLQHTLRSICLSPNSSSSSPKWVYAVFWRILPRNFPPPRWGFGGNALDRSKGNKRNWILVWEDGFCDFNECELRNRRFGADIFFKMSHEVYNYGEGNQGLGIFNSTQSIAVIAVREGVVQLGSFDKIAEDLNLVINIQRKFSYLQSIPGLFAIQRPYIVKPNFQLIESNGIAMSDSSSMIAIDLGWNHPQSETTGPPHWLGPPLMPGMSCSLGATLNSTQALGAGMQSTGKRVKFEDCGFHTTDDSDFKGGNSMELKDFLCRNNSSGS